MADESSIYKIISVILLIMVIVFAGLYFTKTADYPEVEEKALMFGVLNSWGENIYNSSEYLLDVDVYNFGNVEAKNIELVCNIYIGDEDEIIVSETPVITVIKNIGNLASTSYEDPQLEAEKNPQKE